MAKMVFVGVFVILCLFFAASCDTDQGAISPTLLTTPDDGESPADDDDAAADDDAIDDDDQVAPSPGNFCNNPLCSDQEDFLVMADAMFTNGNTDCGDITPESSFFEVLGIADLVESRKKETVLYHLEKISETDTYTVYELVMSDPYIGPNHAYLYVPVNLTGRHAAVLMTHGHGSNPPEVFSRGGRNLIEKGYVVLAQSAEEFIIEMWDIGEYRSPAWVESITTTLVPFERTSYGLLVYRSMLMLDFLESLPYVDSTRIGAWGHSGGGMLTVAMAALDSRVKRGVYDFDLKFPSRADVRDFNYCYEELIPRMFCWGEDDRLLSAAAPRVTGEFEYGYPGGTVTDAVEAMELGMKSANTSGNGICEPGEDHENTPSDCADMREPVKFEKTDTILEQPMIEDDFLAPRYLADRFWSSFDPPSGEYKTALRKALWIDRFDARMPCLAGALHESTDDFHGYQADTRTLCFGDAKPLPITVYRPDDETELTPVVLFLTDSTPFTETDEESMILDLLDAGLRVLAVEPPQMAYTDDNFHLVPRLWMYGLSTIGIQVWQIGNALSGYLLEFGDLDTPVAVFGSEGASVTALYLAALDDRIGTVAAGMYWPLYEPDRDATEFRINPASVFLGQSKLGTLDTLLAHIQDRNPYLFAPEILEDRTEDVVDFLVGRLSR